MAKLPLTSTVSRTQINDCDKQQMRSSKQNPATLILRNAVKRNNVLQITKISSNYIQLLPLELPIDRYAEVMAKHRLNDTVTEMLLYPDICNFMDLSVTGPKKRIS